MIEDTELIEEKAAIGNLAPLMSSNNADWGTPKWFFKALDDEFHFDVDLCASMENRKLQKFFSVHQDAFKLQWLGHGYCNPPYSRDIHRWFSKGMSDVIRHKSTVVYLVPARTDTQWWFNYARLGEVRFLEGRLTFELSAEERERIRLDNIIRKEKGKKLRNPNGDAAPFPSAVVIYRPGLPRSTTYWRYKEIDYCEPGYIAEQLA